MSVEGPPDGVAAGDPRAILLSPDAPDHTPWHRRRAPLLAVAVAAIVAVTVVTDLPTTSSRASNIAGAAAFVREVSSDVHPCAVGATQSEALRTAQLDHTLSAADRANAVSFLTGSEDGCTGDNGGITDLLGIDEPGTTAHIALEDMLTYVTEWATVDAYYADVDVQLLITDPASARAETDLARRDRALASDRAHAYAELLKANGVLHADVTGDLSLPRRGGPRAPGGLLGHSVGP